MTTEPEGWQVPNAVYFGLTLVGLFSLTLLSMSLIFEDVYGAWVLNSAPDKDPWPGENLVVGIVDSNVRRLYSKNKAEGYIRNWTGFLNGIRVKHKRLEPDDQEGFKDFDEVDLVVVITPQGLTAPERRAIQSALAEGKGGVFTVSTHMNKDEGVLYYGAFWRELLDPKEARIHEFEHTTFLPFVSNTPFAGSGPRSGGTPSESELPLGSGIEFKKGMKVLAVAQGRGSLQSPSGALVDNETTMSNAVPILDGSPTLGQLDNRLRSEDRSSPRVPIDRVVMYNGTYEKGRWVIMGFDPTGVPMHSPSRKEASQILIGAFEWVMGRPSFQVRPWPHPYNLALHIAVDLPIDHPQAEKIETQLLKFAKPITVFRQVSGIQAQTADAKTTDVPIEIATRGLSNEPFRGRAKQAQLQDLLEAKAALASVSGIEPNQVAGFMAPAELYDQNTLEALIAAGYRYIFGRATKRWVVPQVWRPQRTWWNPWDSDNPIVILPRTIEDDLGIYLIEPGVSPTGLADRYVKELERFRNLEGLFTITLHSDFFDAPDAYEALRSMVDRVRRPDIWLATGEDIARWWRQRENVFVSLEPGPPHRLILRLSNVGKETVENIVIRVHLPEKATRLRPALSHFRRTTVNDYQVIHAVGNEYADVVIDSFPVGANETLYLDW